MYGHYKHKTKPHRYLYLDESAPGLNSMANWIQLAHIERIDDVPESHRSLVDRYGNSIYEE